LDSLGVGCAILLVCFGVRIAGELYYSSLTAGRHSLFALLGYHDSFIVLTPTFLFGVPGFTLLEELWPGKSEAYEALFVARTLSVGICLAVLFLVAWCATWTCCRRFRFDTTPGVVGGVLARWLGIYLLLDLGLHGLAVYLRLETPSFGAHRDFAYRVWYAAPWLLLAGIFPWVAERLRAVAGAPAWKGAALGVLSLVLTFVMCGVIAAAYLVGWIWLYPPSFAW